MADFNNLALTANGIKALLSAQAGKTLKLTKIGMGSGATTESILNLTNMVTPEVMIPISEKKINDESGYLAIVAKMTNKDISEGFYWRETGLFFEDENGNDVLFAYACVVEDQYDYVPAYSDKRYVKHVRIANILTDSANIEIKENEGLLYVDTLTFEEYKELVGERFKKVEARPVNNNLLINSNFANPVNQRGKISMPMGTTGYWLDRWKKYDNISASLGDGYVEIARGNSSEYITLIQIVEESLLGKTITFSVKPYGVDDVVSVTVTVPTHYSDIESNKLIASSEYLNNVGALIYLRPDGLIHVAIIPKTNSTIRVEWAKLEIGNVATPYVPRLYAEEFVLCQRYYQLLPMLDANLYVWEKSFFQLTQSLKTEMRTVPTVNFDAISVIRNGNIEAGYNISLINISKYHVIFKVAKDNHGISFENPIALSGRIALDAEL